MRRIPWLALVFLAGMGFSSFTGASEFKKHWEDPDAAIVLDPYGPNRLEWDKVHTDPKVVAIIHKATEGGSTDSQYAVRHAKAKQLGYLWGSYHLGRPGDASIQAQHYLDVTDPEEDELMALDLEGISSSFMSLAKAKAFLQYAKDKKGRFPVVYANGSVVNAICANYPANDSVFSKVHLWLAAPQSNIESRFPKRFWSTYLFWQFSSELNCDQNHPERCLYRVPGTDYDMDINVYQGTVTGLRAKWPFATR